MADRSASMMELKALNVPSGHYDVAVLGGGLAGLSMALQLKRERPDTRVLVTDKRLEPAPDAAFKVGESSVENGAHYYREVVGMRDHLEEQQLRKLGLRFYLPAGDNSDITKRVEFCTPAHLDAFTHQIDRGRFENELFRRCRKAGADAFRGWRVQEIELGPEKHEISLSQEDDTTTVTARWIVDASGRANLLRRKLDLGTDTGHHSNAVVPAGRRPRLRGVGGRRRGVAQPDAGARPAPPLDHPPDRSGLLAVADPARHGADQHRRLRRPAVPSVRRDQLVRRLSRLDAAERAAAGRRDRGAPGGRARLPARGGLLVRVEPRLLGRGPLDPGGRGGGLHRRPLFAGLRLHRLHQHDELRADQARPGRRGRHASSATSTTTSSSACSTRRSSCTATSTSCSATRR